MHWRKQTSKCLANGEDPSASNLLNRVQRMKIPSICSQKGKKHDMNTRHVEKYQVEYANTERKRNSPIIYMQKLLNANV